VFRQLLAGGLLYADAQAYGALRLTDAARPVLKGETVLQLRRQVVSRRTRKSALVGRRKESMSAPADSNPALFEALRTWRATQAKTQGVPAYVILHDKTLHELASRQPDSPAALLDVPGIGQAKAERYGAELLELIAKTQI
jgi:ATP-dependent DNA helicase RecQ